MTRHVAHTPYPACLPLTHAYPLDPSHAEYTPDINVNVLAAEGTEGGVLAQEHANFGSLTQKITSVHVDIPGMRLVWCVRGVATDPASATWHAVHFLNEGDAIKAQRLLELLRPGQEDGRVTMATPGAKKGKPTTAAMGQGHRPTGWYGAPPHGRRHVYMAYRY